MIVTHSRYEDNLGFKDFSVTASCAAGYQGTALVEKCRKGGEPYQLSGCGGAQCTVPAKIPFQRLGDFFSAMWVGGRVRFWLEGALFVW